MAGFVADASASLPWCFEDEATSWSESLLNRLIQGEPLFVPAHWIAEMTNALRTAERKGRIQPGDAEVFLEKLDRLLQQTPSPITIEQAKAALALSRKHLLTIYDAIYLAMALRLGLELATLDKDLMAAALSEGVKLC